MDAAKGQTIRTFSGHPQPAYGLAISPDGKWLVSGDESARIWMWNIATGQRVREFQRRDTHMRGVQSIGFSPDGRTVVTTGKDDVVMVWNPATGQPIRKIEGKGANFFSAGYGPRGMLFAPTLGDGVRFYNPANYALAGKVEAHDGQGVNDLAFNAGRTIGITAGRNGIATLWNLQTRSRINSLRGHNDWVIRAALSPNGRLAATSSSDRTVIVWDTRTFKPVAKLENQSMVGAPVCFTADGQFLVTANDADALQIYRVSPAQPASAPAAPGRRR